MFKPLLLAGALLGLFAGCKKEQSPLEQLPAATQEGLNTAGWLLDGKAWVPARSSISTGPPVNGFWEKTKTGHALSISFRQFSIDEDWAAGFSLLDIQRAGTFVLNQNPSVNGGRFITSYGQYYHSRSAPRINYYTGPDAPGEIVITRFDTVQNIVSGTFMMVPRDKATGGPVEITQGRFDLQFDR